MFTKIEPNPRTNPFIHDEDGEVWVWHGTSYLMVGYSSDDYSRSPADFGGDWSPIDVRSSY